MSKKFIASRLTRMRFILLALASVLAPSLSFAKDEPWQLREPNEVWRAECSACHIAFPPALLPSNDWLAIMSQLDKHYGADASLDPKVVEQITNYLDRNGGRGRSFDGEGLPRITAADWFLRKHRGAMRMLLKGKVKSLADCGACHKGPEIEKMTGSN